VRYALIPWMKLAFRARTVHAPHNLWPALKPRLSVYRIHQGRQRFRRGPSYYKQIRGRWRRRQPRTRRSEGRARRRACSAAARRLEQRTLR
jgi:hypothetical protein